MSALLSDRDLHRAFPDVSNVPILLQKSLAALLNNNSVLLMRFALEAIDDGAAQSRPRWFFYSFRLDEAVPDDHPVRAIAAVLDLS